VVRQSSNEQEKKALIGLAVTWTQAASLSERKVCRSANGLTLA
jgi:hypothetical protein